MTRGLREAFIRALADTPVEAQAAKYNWTAITLTVVFAAAAVVFVSIIAVMSVVA